ncbi:MAG: DNA methyltransferase [Acidobacteriota bacterium]
MQNREELSRLAEQSGFELQTEGSASVCVAAPHYDPADRYRAFNFRRDPSTDLIEHNAARLREAARNLEENGLMFIYGLPAHLARYAAALSCELQFRYWISVRAATDTKPGGLRPEHTGLLLMSKPGAEINRIRIPHARCRHCGETLKDWGGKSHLMREDGAALSDVWMDTVVDTSDRMPPEVFERILLLSQGRKTVRLLCDDTRRASFHYFDSPALQSFDPIEWKGRREANRKIPDEMLNRLHRASCLDALRAIPSETIDLAFADPPFNLTKDYRGYADDRSDYTGWCKRWLVEYERALKPGGALFLVNLPRWSFWLADYLMRSGSLYLQNWIVWNSLPEPKGVLMPAHYSVLYLTKGERAARLNYCSMEEGWQPFDEAVFPPDRPDVCRRRSCIRKRRAAGKTWRGELTDVWYDIHRERLATTKAGLNIHPCRTPERLLDRIIRLATNPGDTVLDAFAGVGTSAMVARRLGRNFIAIEQSGDYLRAAERRMQERSTVFYPRNATPRRHISKRKLQLELQRLALMLERLPTRADVEKYSKYDLALFDSAFAQWSVALKAAKAVLIDSAQTISADAQFEAVEQSESGNQLRS